MTQIERILKYLKENKGCYCDDCLSEKLEIKPRQSINQKCNKLSQERKINRSKFRCDICGKEKFTNYCGSIKK